MLPSFLVDKMVLISMQDIVGIQLTKFMIKLALYFEEELSKYMQQGGSRITYGISEEDLILIKINKQPSDVLFCVTVSPEHPFGLG